MKEQKTASDLKLVGNTQEVVLGTFSIGGDAFGELIALQMEFGADQPNSAS